MPQIPVQPPLRRAARRWLRATGAALAAFLLVTCSSDSPIGPGRPGIASLQVAPVFDAYARVAPLTLDNVKVIVVRPPSDTVANVSKPFSATANQLQLSVPVFLQAVSEDLEVTLELYSGSTLLFRGTSTVRVSQGSTTPPGTVPVSYQGPGSQVASLSISPRDTTLSFGATAVPFAVSALDGSAQSVTQYYVSWSTVGAPTGTTVDGAGRLTVPSVRDTFFLKVVTPTGIADSTQVFVAASASALVKSSGDNQTGLIGSRLAQPLAVQVNGSDGLPVAGTVVSFAVTTGGGSVDSATATADAQGIARSGVVLGNLVGAQTFTASAAGLTPVVFSATATGSAGIVTWTGATDGAWTTATNWSPAVVPGAADSVVIPAGLPNDPTFTGTSSIAALTLTGTNSLLTLAGNLTVARGVALPDTNSSIEYTSGQLNAASVAIAGFQAFIDASVGGLAVSGPVTIPGDRAFIDATGPGTNGFGPLTLTGSQAFVSQRGGTAGAISISGPNAFWQVEGTVAVTGTPALQLTGNTSFVTTSSTVATDLTFNGDVSIGGTGSFFSLGNGGSRATVNGNLSTSGTGTLQQTFAGDTVKVNGNATFGGGNESTLLTAGGLFVSGNLSQTGAGTTFVGSGTHSVFLNGSGPQTVNFAAPGFAAARFQNVIVANTAGAVNVTSDLYATGTVGVTPTAVRTLSGNGSTLFTTILNVGNFTFNNLLLNFAGSTVVTFDTVTFQGYAATATPLTISHPGAAAPLSFLNTTFSVVPTTGFYLKATDTNPSDGVPLVIDMTNPSPLSGGSFVQTAGGATVNWPAGVAPGTWTGTVDTSWNTAGNWSDGQVPTATTDVTIPSGTPFAAFTSGTARPTRNLTVQSGATLTLSGGGLSVNGSLDAAGLITGTTTGLTLAGTGTARGNVLGSFFLITVNGSYTLGGRLAASGITVNGSLTLGGFTAQVGDASGDDFQTANNGVLVMTNPADSLIVGGVNPTALFDGASTAGKLTAGIILLNSSATASFDQSNTFNDSSYAPSGSHKVVFATGGVVLVSMSSPGTGSQFNHLDISAQATGITLQTPIRVNGIFTSAPSATAPAINGGNRLTTLAGPVQVTGLTLTNAPFALVGDNPVSFDNVALQSFTAAATQLAISGTGAASRQFNNLTFSTTPTSGFYVSANDLDGPGTNGALTVDLVNPAPATDGGHTIASNGAVINWPASGNLHTWTGAVDNSWENPLNWTGGGGPGIAGDALIPAGPATPVLSSSHQINSLTVQAGASVNLAGFTLTMGGDLLAPSATAGFIGGGSLGVIGTGTHVGGNLGGVTLDVGGTVTVNARVVTGALSVSGTGDLTLGGQTVVVNGAVTTSATGVLSMTNPLDSLLVTGAGTFGGGDETGKLTAGYLKLGGSFGQSATNSPASFAASGTHRTEMGAGAVRVINFASSGAGAGTSHFNDLIVSGAAGGINIAANTFVNGQLISHPTGATPVIGIVAAARVLTVGGVDISGLGIDQNVMTIGAGVITQFDNVAFTGQANGVNQLTITNPGAAAPHTFTGVSFAVTPTTGHYIAATDADGATPNALTINMASATPAAPSPSLFTASNGAVINWPPVAPTITWTGAVSTDWSVAGNWSPAQVPTSANPVVIPSSLPIATVTSTCAAKTLTVNGQMSVGANSCQVSGSVISNGVITGTTGTIQLVAAGNINGNFPGLVISAPVTVVGATGLGGGAGNVTITGAGASLTMNGQTLVAPGSLSVQGGGVLIMTNPADVLTIQTGGAVFDGGDETGKLTAGTLTIFGNFTQSATSSGASFFASGNHKTVLGGPAKTVAFATPATSRFQELDVSGSTATITLGSNVTVAGQLISIVGGSNGPTVTGTGVTLTAGGADVGGPQGVVALTMDKVPLILSGGTISGFSNVTFTNQSQVGIGLTVSNVGAPSAFTFANLAFNYGLTAGGFYIQANDLDGATPNALTLDVIGATPVSGAGVSQATNGAIINWPPAGATITWTGAVSQDWNDAGNWSPAVVPTVIDNVVLVPITNQPQLTSNVGINNLTSTAGSILDLGGFILVAGGTVDLAGQINGAAGSGVSLTGSGALLRGTINTLVAVVGSYILNGNLVVTGDMSVNGSLDLSSFNATVSGNFLTSGNGVLVMTTPGGFLDVGGSAIFAGGSTSGLLTQGTIQIAGDFSQLATTSPQSFAASPGHLTQFSNNPVNFLFQTPGITQSHFGDLAETGFGAQFVLQSDMTILGFLSGGDGFGGSFLGSTCPSTLTVTNWNNGVTLDCVRLVIDDPTGASFGMSSVNFQNLPTNVTQLTIRHPGLATGNWSAGNLDFVPLSGGDTGHYIDITDTDGNPPFLVAQPFATNVLNGPAFTTSAGGASVIWPNATITWTGAVDNNWFLAGNWDLGIIPGTASTAVIPGGPANQPSLIGNVNVAALTINGGSLTINGNTVNVSGNFATVGNGTITMNSVFSTLNIGGDALFSGGDELGKLTTGQLIVAGNFSQSAAGGSVTSFAPSGTHATFVGGAGATTIDIESPGSGSGGSHFQNLDLSNATGGATLLLNTIVDSVFSASNTAAKLIGNGASLTMRYAQVSGLTVDNAPLILDEQGVAVAENLSNITFQGFATTGTTMLKFTGPGGTVAARPTITTNGLTFQSLPVGAGNFYLDVAVTNGGFMTFNLNGSNQGTSTPGGNGAVLTRTTGGTVTVNWP